MTLNLVNIGSRIKELRGNESQFIFANRFDIHQNDVSRLEKGEVKNPKIEILFNIARYYGRPLTWLLTGENPDISEISQEEEKVLTAFRNATEKERLTVLAALDLLEHKNE